MKFRSALFLLVFLMVSSFSIGSEEYNVLTGLGDVQAVTCLSPKEYALRSDLRRLWKERVEWDRAYVIASLANLPEVGATGDRLLKNQADLSHAVRLYYGDAGSDQLAALLNEHVLIAFDLIKALKEDNYEVMQEKYTAIMANADATAIHLNQLSPQYFEPEATKELLRGHLEAVGKVLYARVSQDWAEEVVAYDLAQVQAREMADHMANAIVRQFPEQFEQIKQ